MLILKHHLDTQICPVLPIQAFLRALDALLSAGFQGNNHEVSALFNIVENMLKLIGPLLSASQTKRSSTEIGKKYVYTEIIHFSSIQLQSVLTLLMCFLSFRGGAVGKKRQFST